MQRSFTRKTKACAEAVSSGRSVHLKEKGTGVPALQLWRGQVEIPVTNVTMREEGGGPGERHQRDRGGKSQGLKCHMLRWEAVWEKEDAEACFMGGLHSSFF